MSDKECSCLLGYGERGHRKFCVRTACETCGWNRKNHEARREKVIDAHSKKKTYWVYGGEKK